MRLVRPSARGFGRVRVTPVAALLALSSLVVAPSCAPHAKSPEVVLGEVKAALTAGDPARLYALLSPEERQRVPFPLFQQRCQEEHEDLVALGATLAKSGSTFAIETVWETASGDTPRVISHNGQAFVDPTAVFPFSPRTPEAALVALRHALKKGVTHELLTLFADATKKGLESELSSILDSLADPQALPIVEDGDHARAILKAGHQVKLIRADGVWKIESFE